MKSDLERAREVLDHFVQPDRIHDDFDPCWKLVVAYDGQLANAMLAFAKSECATRDAEIERLRDARNLAYGLMWGMSIDRRRISDDLAARARESLLATMTKDEQRAGIDAARAALSNKDAG